MSPMMKAGMAPPNKGRLYPAEVLESPPPADADGSHASQAAPP
jgi:hypothetical protein